MKAPGPLPRLGPSLCSSPRLPQHIMVNLKWPYPCTIAWMGLATTTVASFAAIRLSAVAQRLAWVSGGGGGGALAGTSLTAAVTPRYYLTRVLPTGFFMALTFQTGNMGYLYLTVAFVQMLKVCRRTAVGPDGRPPAAALRLELRDPLTGSPPAAIRSRRPPPLHTHYQLKGVETQPSAARVLPCHHPSPTHQRRVLFSGPMTQPSAAPARHRAASCLYRNILDTR
jgi:hypothetical protein